MPEPLHCLHVSGRVPGGTPDPPGKKRRIKYGENHSCSNKLTYIQHYLTIICKLQLNRKAIKILFNTMKDTNEDAA